MQIPPPEQLWMLATGYFLPRCLHIVAELGVADQVGEEPVTADQIAACSGADALLSLASSKPTETLGHTRSCPHCCAVTIRKPCGPS